MLSFVIPARNEDGSIRSLAHGILTVCLTHGYAHEIILVDDGSTDGTWEEIDALTRRHASVRGIRLRRSFGKGAALSAGFAAVRGDTVVMMDADLQDDPADIPRFVEALAAGDDVVVGWRHLRRDSWGKRMQSRLFNAALRISGVKLHDHNCGFKALRTEVLSEICLYGDMHRYVPILAHMRGFRVSEVKVTHHPRRHGRSKYGLARTYRGFFDLLTIMFLKGFRHRPMHFLGSLGLVATVVGVSGLAYLAVRWLIDGHIGHRPLLVYATAASVLGGQLLATGVLAELMTTYMVRRDTLYSVREDTAERGMPMSAGAGAAIRRAGATASASATATPNV